mgnify:CR=1 FL=1
MAEVLKYYPDARIRFKPDPEADIGLSTIPKVIESGRAEKEWGWSVSYSLEDTVKDFIQEYGGLVKDMQ